MGSFILVLMRYETASTFKSPIGTRLLDPEARTETVFRCRMPISESHLTLFPSIGDEYGESSTNLFGLGGVVQVGGLGLGRRGASKDIGTEAVIDFFEDWELWENVLYWHT